MRNKAYIPCLALLGIILISGCAQDNNGIVQLTGNLFSVNTTNGKLLFFVPAGGNVFTEEETKSVTGLSDIYPVANVDNLMPPTIAKQKVRDELTRLYPSSNFSISQCISDCVQDSKVEINEHTITTCTIETPKFCKPRIAESDCPQYCSLRGEQYGWQYPLFSNTSIEEPLLIYSGTNSGVVPTWYHASVILSDGRRSEFKIYLQTGELTYNQNRGTPSIITCNENTSDCIKDQLSIAQNKLREYLLQNNIQGNIVEGFYVEYLV